MKILIKEDEYHSRTLEKITMDSVVCALIKEFKIEVCSCDGERYILIRGWVEKKL